MSAGAGAGADRSGSTCGRQLLGRPCRDACRGAGRPGRLGMTWARQLLGGCFRSNLVGIFLLERLVILVGLSDLQCLGVRGRIAVPVIPRKLEVPSVLRVLVPPQVTSERIIILAWRVEAVDLPL